VATENAQKVSGSDPESASENTAAPSRRRRGRAAVTLAASYIGVLDGYTAALRSAPLSDQTRRTYTSKVRQYLAWLADADLDSDPLTSTDGRDWAARDYRTHLQAVLKRSRATINNALAAVDDFYTRRSLGPASAARVEIATAAPRALDKRAQVRYLRAVQACPSPRDQALALVPFLRRRPNQRDRRPRHRRHRPLRPQRRTADLWQRRTRPPRPDPPAAAHRTHRLAQRARRLARRQRQPRGECGVQLRVCSSTNAASASASAAPTTSSPRSPRRRPRGPYDRPCPAAYLRYHARARRHRSRDRRRAPRPRTPRGHPRLHPPQRRRPHTSARPAPRRRITAIGVARRTLNVLFGLILAVRLKWFTWLESRVNTDGTDGRGRNSA